MDVTTSLPSATLLIDVDVICVVCLPFPILPPDERSGIREEPPKAGSTFRGRRKVRGDIFVFIIFYVVVFFYFLTFVLNFEHHLLMLCRFALVGVFWLAGHGSYFGLCSLRGCAFFFHLLGGSVA